MTEHCVTPVTPTTAASQAWEQKGIGHSIDGDPTVSCCTWTLRACMRMDEAQCWIYGSS